MKVPGGHLTYCTNIHAGDSWPDVLTSLETHLPPIRREVAKEQRFGLGLRLSAAAAEALRAPAAFGRLTALLAANDAYVFTINGFPYGAFHGRPVKEQVYQPDWRQQERLAYSNQLTDLLAALLPDDPDLEGSISTVPGTFRPLAAAPGAIDQIADNLIRHAAHLVRVRERTGRTIGLALEPEPCCLLETIDETVGFFEQHLFSRQGVRRLASLTGLSPAAAEVALRRHLGVCYDVCHAAVEFEDPRESVAALRRAGIRILKLQISAALRIAEVAQASADRLRGFDESVYLHQVVARRERRLTRFRDLPDALAEAAQSQGDEWRIHFHVPVFLAELGDLATTQDFLTEILALQRTAPISHHLEIETYTFDVLPERYRRIDVAHAIVREFRWVLEQLQ